jgi:hypothetical protein
MHTLYNLQIVSILGGLVSNVIVVFYLMVLQVILCLINDFSYQLICFDYSQMLAIMSMSACFIFRVVVV